MSEQNEKDEKRRSLALRRTKQALRVVLTNPDGLRRLRQISDEEWAEAEQADEGEGA